MTDTRITIWTGEQTAVLNRAALLIDGEKTDNVVAFPGASQQKAAVSA